jgi:uncharacterized membrane-anchored protein
MEDQSHFDSFELQVTEAATEYLRESAKWCLILSILGFVGLGFMVLAAFFVMVAGAATPFGAGGAVGIGFLYLVMALLYFFPIYYLYKYATQMKAALNESDNSGLTSAFENLKSHHKFLAITAIVVISLYILIILGAVVFGLSKFI